MSYVWHWPMAQHANAIGQEGSGLDQFEGDRSLNHLAREAIQNSLDARKDKNQVVVEFSLFKTKPNSFLDLNGFFFDYIKKYIDSEKSEKMTAEKQLMEDIYREFANANSKDEIVWLRISDKGTTGLKGVSTPGNQKLPWFAFINGVGKNTKEVEASGGSKGLGKNAIFANSNIRTLFISTLTELNEKGHIGVSKLVSLTVKDGSDNPDWTQGVGYCVQNDKEAKKKICPTAGMLNLDEGYSRSSNEYGTDIFIPFFKVDEENWASTLISEAILSFMPSIYDGDLRVIVANKIKSEYFEVSKENLSSILNDESYFENSSCFVAANEIYQTIAYPNKTETHKVGRGDEMVLKVSIGSTKAKKRVFIYRWNTKMLITTHVVPTSIQYTGVLFIKGIDLCNKLKSVEDATHSGWSKRKYVHSGYNKEQISQALDSVANFIDKTIETIELGDIGKESDFIWAADEGWSSENSNTLDGTTNEDTGLPTSDVVFDPPKKRKEKKHRHPLKRSATSESSDGEAENYIEGLGIISDTGELEASSPTGHNDNNGGEMHPGDNKFNVDESESGDPIMIRKPVGTIKSQMPVKDLSKGKFKLSFVPSRSGDNVQIKILKSGEGDEYEKPIILSAEFKGEKLEVTDNTILFKNIHKGDLYEIEVVMKEHKIYQWEVQVDAY